MASRAISRLLLVAVAISASIALAKPQDEPAARPGRPNYPGGRPYSRPAWLPTPTPAPSAPSEIPANPPVPGDENGSGGQESDDDLEAPGTGNSGGTDGGIGGGIGTPGDENPTNPAAAPGPEPSSGGSGDNRSGSPTNADGSDDDDDDDDDNNDEMGQAGSSESSGGGLSDNRTLVITLSSVLSVVALFLILATIAACYRVKNGRLPFLPRGTSPIDDEEIESWKRGAADEKFTSKAAVVTRLPSTAGSVKKPPSVIIYQNNNTPPLASGAAAAADTSEHPSPRSVHTVKKSLDLTQPGAAVIARAPNSRPGLTDETVEGDKAFIASATPTHKRQHSRRLSKATSRHKRTRSSRSSVSLSSYRDTQYHYHQHYHWHGATASAGPSPRASNEYAYYYPRTSHSYDRKHSRIYSSSSNPPRASFDDEYYAGGLSPRPLLAGMNGTPESEIGRAIG